MKHETGCPECGEHGPLIGDNTAMCPAGHGKYAVPWRDELLKSVAPVQNAIDYIDDENDVRDQRIAELEEKLKRVMTHLGMD